MSDEIKILILEDFEPDAELIAREIRKAGVLFHATRVDAREDYMRELEENPPDIIISDYSFPSFDGPTALKIAKELFSDIPFIFVSGTLGEEAAISTLRNGATDYVLKGKIGRLGPAVIRALQEAEDRKKAKEAGEALRKSEFEKNTILQTVPEFITYRDLDYRIIWANRTVCETYGVRSEELPGRLCYSIFQNRTEPCEKCATRKSIISRQMAEEIVTNSDGRVVLVRSYPVIDDKGIVTGAVEIGSDITREIEGRKRDRLAANVFENTSDAIMVVDHSGNIQSVNQAFLEMSGYKLEELIGKNYGFLDYSTIDANVTVEDIGNNMIINGKWMGEVYQRHYDGHLIPASASISTIKDDSGKPVQYVAILRDITERYKMQQEKEKIQKNTARMERIASIAAMSAGVVHEIAQPVNAIKIISDGMLICNEMGQDLDTKEVMENLQGISKQVLRIESIIQHMRSLASTSERVDCMPCSINAAFESAYSMMERRIKSHSIRVEKSLADNLPSILAHENRLEEIIINLLDNAVHALDNAQEADKIVFCSTRLENELVVLEISDTGSGIDETLLATVFEPFFTTKAGGGMGLGLSIVQSLVTRYGGQINAFNNELGGATFQIRFPILQTVGD